MIDRIEEPWGERTPYGRGDRWPARVDIHLEPGLEASDVDRWVASASVLHSNGDGIDIAVHDGRIAGVRGRAADRVNRGRLDPKDVYGWQANNAADRLTQPLVRGEDGELHPTTWEHAVETAATGLRKVIDTHGPQAVAFLASARLTNEENYLIQKLARTGVGTNSVHSCEST